MKELLISAEKIIDCLNDGVYVCDRDRRIVFWSKAAERITGWRSEDVLGRACLEDILNHVDFVIITNVIWLRDQDSNLG